MVSLGFSPSWFFQYGIILELVFAILASLVAIYSFKVYKLSKERSIKVFGTAFLLFAISYFIQSVLNIGILYELSKNVPAIAKVSTTVNLGWNALYSHMILVLTGLVLLSTIFFKTRNIKMFLLLLTISLAPIFFNRDPLMNFFILSTIYLVFITYHYLRNFTKNTSIRCFIVFFAFFLLLLSNFGFIMALKNSLYYVVAHFFILIAYILILINLYWIRNEKTR